MSTHFAPKVRCVLDEQFGCGICMRSLELGKVQLRDWTFRWENGIRSLSFWLGGAVYMFMRNVESHG